MHNITIDMNIQKCHIKFSMVISIDTEIYLLISFLYHSKNNGGYKDIYHKILSFTEFMQ